MRNGISLRMTHLLSQMHHKHEITLIHQNSQETESKETETSKLLHHIHAIAAQEDIVKSKLERFLDRLRMYRYSPSFHQAIREIVSKQDFDVVLSYHPSMLQYALDLNGLPVVADLVDDPVLGVWRELKARPDLLHQLNLGRLLPPLLWYQRKFCPQAAVCIVCAHADAQSLQKFVPKTQVRIVANGVDLNYFRTDFSTSNGISSLPEKYELMFSGNMNFDPNIAGAEYFYQRIFPLIREREPQIRWAIVGDCPAASVNSMAADPQVMVTGFVEDIRPWFEKCSVVVSPLVSGSGIKNKILEAWAMGKPVIATSLGCAGLLARNEENILIADSPEEFARKTLLLLHDPERAKTIGQAGLQTVRQHYSWKTSARELEQILCEAALARSIQISGGNK
jgi:glycosyltransferase involved in cell wall biosynthesis